MVGIKTTGVAAGGEVLLPRSSGGMNSKEREARGDKYHGGGQREIENNKVGHKLKSPRACPPEEEKVSPAYTLRKE